jgi:hypothetical protein
MAFWSKRIRFGVPRKVIGAGFGGGGGPGMGLLWGSGASGSEAEVEASAMVGCDAVGWDTGLWAVQSRPVASRRVAVRQREARGLGRVKSIGKGIGKVGRQLTATPCWRLP